MKTKIIFQTLALLMAFTGCVGQNQKADEAKVTKETPVKESQAVSSDTTNEREEMEEWSMLDDIQEDANERTEEENEEMDEFLAKGGLNGIRFEGWTEKEFLNNEYIRTLRKYIDAYLIGKEKVPELDPYKENIRCPFAVYGTMPYPSGGLLITFIFIDMPEKMFDAWVYSSVDAEKRIVFDYQVHDISVSAEEGSLTKEEILQIIKENPTNKLW